MKLFPTSAGRAAIAAVEVLLALALLPGCRKPAPPAPPPKPGAASVSPKTNAPAATTNLSLEFVSVFDDTLPRDKARDPFFPDSLRTAPSATNTDARPVAPPPPVAPELKLLAISGSEKRRVATINNSILEADETADIRTVSGKASVHILEIGADYVVLTIEGMAGQTRLNLERKKQ
jgi:hypothetical protein